MKTTEPKNDSKNIVITGLGVISSIGIGYEEFWTNLLAGQSGIRKITEFNTSGYERKVAGSVKNFEPERYISKRRMAQMGRAARLGIAASKLAVKDAGLTKDFFKDQNAGVCVGTTMGEPQVMEHLDEKIFPDGKYHVAFLDALTYPASSISNHIAKEFQLNKFNIVFSTACAAGNYAIGRSFDLLRQGKVDYMLAGGVDAFSRIAFTGFSRLLVIAPQKCQPFDKNRKGMIPGEGAGILVLERLESAQKRGAKIYAKVLGYGLSCDAHHMIQPHVDGIASCMEKAVKEAGIEKHVVNYISAHGTGTPANDKTECAAIHQVFGKKASDIPVSSIKSMLGHTMGAASALEAITCSLALRDQIVPPTINFEEKDPECDVDCVPNFSRKLTMNVVLNNSCAFGGNNACLVLGRG